MAGTTVNVPSAAPGGPPERPGEKPEVKTPEELAALREEIDETGEAEKYIETFQKQPQFDAVSHLLGEGINHEGTESAFNFNNWLIMDSKFVARIFDIEFMPRGKGRLSFLDGLENPDQESEEFKKSQKVLKKIVDLLKKRFDTRQEIREDSGAQRDKPAAGETIGDGVKTLMRNFKRASGTEKVMILGAIGIAASLLWKYKDQALFKNFTFGDAVKWAGALWGINYLSGKVSKDGKTFIQRVDVGLDIEAMKDSPLKGYAYEHGMDKDQEKYRTFLQLQTKDVRLLYQRYKEVSAPGVKKEIDPKRLGIYNEAIDGKAVYEIVDELVQETSINLHIEQRRKEAEDQGQQYNEKADLANKGLIDLWTSPSEAQAKFEEKYFGLMKGANVTLIDAILNEYQTRDYQTAITSGRARRRYERAKKTTADVLEKGKNAVSKWAQDNTRWGGKWIYLGVKGGVRTAYEFTRDDILKPAGHFLARKYRAFVEPRLKKGTEWIREKKINEVLDPAFAADVTSEDKVTLMGVPGNDFEIEIGRGIVIINGINFELDKGIPGNAHNAILLESQIQGKVDALVKSKNIPQLAGIKPKWDKANKKWVLEKVPVGADPLLNLPAANTDLSFTIDSDGTTVHFFDGGKEIKNFNKLSEVHGFALIEKKVWEADTALKPHLEGLPVTDITASSYPVHGARIDAKLGGLQFAAVLKASPPPPSINNGIEFLSPSGATGGFNVLKIEQANGGPGFLTALSGKILESPYFNDPFMALIAQMENTSEGVFARLQELFPTTRLWIIPTSLNIPAGINGKILQERFRYTLDFKKYETLQLLEHELQGKTVDQIPNVYKKYIERAHRELTKLWRDIDALSDEDKAKEFEKNMDRLESLNYENDEYRQFFEQYQTKITAPQYNYAGFESLDVDYGAREANEIYQTLLLVWSYHTRKYIKYPKGPSLAPAEKLYLQNKVIDKVVQKLDKALKDGGGTIKKENLPAKGSQNEADFDLWLK